MKFDNWQGFNQFVFKKLKESQLTHIIFHKKNDTLEVFGCSKQREPILILETKYNQEFFKTNPNMVSYPTLDACYQSL